MTRRAWLIPLALFGLLVGLLGAGLRGDPRAVPSPLLDRPMPAFSLPVLAAPQRSMSAADLRGQVWVLNVWASWCTGCRIEHPLLVDWVASQQGRPVPLVGLNYKDAPADAQRWLQRFGNPYAQSLSDLDGRVGIDLGVYGVPETYVIDRHGVIRHKHTGPLTAQVLRDEIAPLVARLQG